MKAAAGKATMAGKKAPIGKKVGTKDTPKELHPVDLSAQCTVKLAKECKNANTLGTRCYAYASRVCIESDVSAKLLDSTRKDAFRRGSDYWLSVCGPKAGK